MKVLNGQEFRLAGLDPSNFRQELALRAVPITTRVVRGVLLTTMVALIEMPTENRGPAIDYVIYDLSLS